MKGSIKINCIVSFKIFILVVDVVGIIIISFIMLDPFEFIEFLLTKQRSLYLNRFVSPSLLVMKLRKVLD